MARKSASDYGKREVLKAFEHFAPGDGTGKIDSKEVVQAMVKWVNIPEQEALKLVSQLETDPAGKWDFKKYINVMAPE